MSNKPLQIPPAEDGSRSEAYYRGRADFDADAEHIANPYPEFSYDWHDWDAGWCDAANEFDGEKF